MNLAAPMLLAAAHYCTNVCFLFLDAYFLLNCVDCTSSNCSLLLPAPQHKRAVSHIQPVLDFPAHHCLRSHRAGACVVLSLSCLRPNKVGGACTVTVIENTALHCHCLHRAGACVCCPSLLCVPTKWLVHALLLQLRSLPLLPLPSQSRCVCCVVPLLFASKQSGCCMHCYCD